MSPRQSSNDEITLRQVILKIREYWGELWQRKFGIIGAGLLMALVFGYRAVIEPTTYQAQLTFMVNDDDGASIGGVAAILGQFGFGGGGRGGQNLEKVVELTKSRRILQSALFDSATINSERNCLANQLIDLYDFHEKWREAEREDLVDFYFLSDRFDHFDTTENRALLSLYSKVKGNAKQNIEGLLSVSYAEETGILNMSLTSENPEFSIALVNRIYQNLSDFYIEKTIEKHTATYENIASKTDSIYSQLSSTEYQLAQLEDRSSGVLLRRDNLSRDRLSKKLSMLTLMYGEAVKNRETAAFLLDNATPYFQIIDAPLAPLTPEKKSWLVFGLIGFILGSLLAGIIILVIYLYRQLGF